MRRYIESGISASQDARPIGDQKVAGLTPQGRQHSFVEIAHIIYTHTLPSADLGRAVDSQTESRIMTKGP